MNPDYCPKCGHAYPQEVPFFKTCGVCGSTLTYKTEKKMPEENVRIPILSSDVRIQIDPEKVNQIVAAAILSSGLGDRIKKITGEFLDNEKTGYGEHGLKKAVLEQINAVVVDIIKSKEFDEQIRAKVRAHITNKIVDDFIKKLVDERLSRGY